jgi:hypothetical protein
MIRYLFILTFLASAPAVAVQAQPSIRIAVLAPLFLDSTYDAGGNYRLGNQAPKYAFPGLEFTEGARLALDTLQASNQSLQYYFYDTRSASGSISKLIASHTLDSVQLIIGSVSGADYQMLAQYAGAVHIPFISATYPNDGGISANPFLIILNPTLQTHCEGIYRFILRNHPTDQILYVRKPGAMEDRLEGYFKQLNNNNGKPLLPIITINASDSVSAALLAQNMDSGRISVIIGGSLDEAFSTSLVRACNSLSESYPMTLMGMPNWSGIRALQSPELRNMPYLLTTGFISPEEDSTASTSSMSQRFNTLTNTKPGDMAYRGYESTYLFTNLLLHYPGNVMSHAADTTFQLYSTYNIKPVFLNAQAGIPDYFENKHIYILRMQNGAVTRLQ